MVQIALQWGQSGVVPAELILSHAVKHSKTETKVEKVEKLEKNGENGKLKVVKRVGKIPLLRKQIIRNRIF